MSLCNYDNRQRCHVLDYTKIILSDNSEVLKLFEILKFPLPFLTDFLLILL